MRIASGKVVGGRVELDGELPEGASVTADGETEQVLLRAIEQCNRAKAVPMTQLLCELRIRD